MGISIKSADEIEKMRVAGRLAAEVLEIVAPHVTAGITTEKINEICHDHIVRVQDAIPAPLDYHGFPRSICTSVNHQVCHGIPNDRKLKNGDIINVDITVIKDGYHGDTSMMFLIGEPSVQARRLCTICNQALWKGIEMVKPGAYFGDIGNAIQRYVEANHFSVVREYCGHGIGKGFHEEPQVLHYGNKGTGPRMEAGMIFTIEPMINAGARSVSLLSDGWTVVTKDRKLSAQYEHTILVTDTGFEVLTLRQGETNPNS